VPTIAAAVETVLGLPTHVVGVTTLPIVDAGHLAQLNGRRTLGNLGRNILDLVHHHDRPLASVDGARARLLASSRGKRNPVQSLAHHG